MIMNLFVIIFMGITPLFASDRLVLSKSKQFAQTKKLFIKIPENTHGQEISEKAYYPDRAVTFKSLNDSILQTQRLIKKPEQERSAAKVRAAFFGMVSGIFGTLVANSEFCTQPDIGVCSGFALFLMTGVAIHQAGSALTRYHGYWCDMALDQDFVKDFVLQRHTPEQIKEFLDDPFLRSTLSPTFVKMLEATWQDKE
ncbi:hypothetical protein KBD08_00565 [Candidatus Babeliales bacterium]|nr:hypothetical protein [Candidatus Babeliales bacterium]